jgi:Ni,Fe-hydrogenase III small subunit/ferredoxin
MLQLFKTRWQQGDRTIDFPCGVSLPDSYRGRPQLTPSLCKDGCSACAAACPTGAITTDPLRLDLGACLFCPACTEACPEGAIRFTPAHQLAVRARGDLVLGGEELKLAGALDARMRSLFSRSLKLRQVAAGDCSGCAAELNALSNVVFDLGRFGVQFVASPRHADGLLITGPVTNNMREALRLAYEAVPAPKLVIAVGACAISGGPFKDSPDQCNGVPPEIPVDLYVPGCPPHPVTVLDGLLRVLGRLSDGTQTPAR